MGHLQKDKVTIEEKIYIIKNVHKPLLGRPAITALKLLSRIGSVKEQKKSVIKQFPLVFKGLACSKESIPSSCRIMQSHLQ